MSISNRQSGAESPGFTLIELIISLTVLSMVVMMLYYAFSTGVKIWNDQSLKSTKMQRQEVLVSLLKKDLGQLSNYILNWEKGQIPFFAGGPTALFYVTRNGLGSRSRSGYELFFSCLYIDSAENGTKGLYLYKTPFPELTLVEELNDFQTMSEIERANYTPGEQVRDKALMIYRDLEDPAFTFSNREFKPFSGANEVFDKEPEEKGLGSLPENEWLKKELPSQIHFNCRLEGEKFFIHAAPQASEEG